MRLGGDSQQTFGHCALCIHPAVEPMATPSGHVYCKECIVEFLLTKTQELKRQKEAFEEQEKNKGVSCTSISAGEEHNMYTSAGIYSYRTRGGSGLCTLVLYTHEQYGCSSNRQQGLYAGARTYDTRYLACHNGCTRITGILITRSHQHGTSPAALQQHWQPLGSH